MKIIFVVEKTATGFSAYADDFEKYAVGTTGVTIPELKQNIISALNSHLEALNKKPIRTETVLIKYDLPQFFEYYTEISAKGVAKRVGISPSLLSQYINGKKIPSAKQVKRILSGVQQLGRELSSLELV